MAPRVYALTCGHLTMPMAAFLAGGEGRLTVPVPAYIVEHDKGCVLFDSGMSPHLAEDGHAYHGHMARSTEVHVAPAELLNARLEEAGFDARRITHLVNSHLHFDHAGGNALAPDVPVVVQTRELAYARTTDPSYGYIAEDYETGQDFSEIDGEHDIFGDGSVTCIPTFGHTPGHQSLRVKTDVGEFVLAGDACYLRRTLDDMHLPTYAFDEEAMRASLRSLRELQARGARIMYGHDPDFWVDVPQAPLRLA